ncbi:hypothetical protein CW712_01240 [Candidatus Bathyarchaeota archaeon]|nr:MAG: hypothetical protein CW712_01240 [Candidatus Bathyarchaeota archaeon]
MFQVFLGINLFFGSKRLYLCKEGVKEHEWMRGKGGGRGMRVIYVSLGFKPEYPLFCFDTDTKNS